MAFAMRRASSDVRWEWPKDHFCKSSRQWTTASLMPLASRTQYVSAPVCSTRQGGGNRRFGVLDSIRTKREHSRHAVNLEPIMSQSAAPNPQGEADRLEVATDEAIAACGGD